MSERRGGEEGATEEAWDLAHEIGEHVGLAILGDAMKRAGRDGRDQATDDDVRNALEGFDFDAAARDELA